MKIYLAGPMAGKPDWNRPAFDHAQEVLEDDYGDVEVVNPARMNDDLEDGLARGEEVSATLRAKFLERDLPALLECDAIAMLPGWELSTGANIELAVAQATGKTVIMFRKSDFSMKYTPALEPDIDLLAGHIQQVIAHKEV